MEKSKPLSAVRTWLRKLSTKNVLLLIVSFLIALFAWAYIASSISTDYSKSFSNIPVTLDTAGTKAEELGLSVLDPPEKELMVNATVAGNRTDIGGLNKNDLVAYVDFSNITDTIGTQTFPIRLRTVGGTALGNSASLSTTSIELTMDRFETQEFNVTDVSHANLSGSNEEVIINEEDIVCEPSTVSIYGPTSQLRLIDHIRVNLSDTESISKTKYYTDVTDITLISADGNAISDTAFQIGATRFSVKVPVIYKHSLPLTVTIANPPSGFDTDTLLSRLRLISDKEYSLPGYGDDNLVITVETDDPDKYAQLADLPAVNIGEIPLSSLSTNMKPIEKAVTLDEGYTNTSNIDTVSVSLDDTELVAVQRWIPNSAIGLINGASNFNYEIQSGRTSITLIGTTEEVMKISTDDLQATINLFNASISDEGTYSLGITVTLPDTVSGVWVSPTPQVNVTATFVEEEE